MNKEIEKIISDCTYSVEHTDKFDNAARAGVRAIQIEIHQTAGKLANIIEKYHNEIARQNDLQEKRDIERKKLAEAK